jgi:hypothetical protein
MSDHASALPHSGASGDAAPPLWWRIGSMGVLTSAVLALLYIASTSWLQAWPRDVAGYVVGRDFLNFWTMGRLAWVDDPGQFYNWQAYNPYLQGFLGPDYPLQQWSYPPQFMLVAIPLGQLPYLIAYGLWTGLGLAALYYAARPWLADRRAIAVVFLSPAALLCFVCGQNAFFTAAALIMIYRWRDERPVLAGIILGLLTLKPQLGLLFPLILLISRRWTLFASAAATAIALLLSTIAVFGLDPFMAYVEFAMPIQKSVVTDPTKIIQSLMPTLYMSLRLLGLSSEAGYIIQTAAFIALAGLAGWTYLRRRDPLLSYGLLLSATALATPYMLSYDLVVFGWLFLAVAMAANPGRAGRWLLGALYWLPMITLALGAAGIPGAALVPIGFTIWLYRELAGQPASEDFAPPAQQN